MRSSTLAKRIAALTLTRKAQDLVIMDLRALAAVTDFFVICSADSDKQVKAIADAVDEGLGQKGTKPWHRESGSANWVLLDYVDVVLHVFHKHTRQFYNLEKLWGDAKVQRVPNEETSHRRKERAASSRLRAARSARLATS